LGIEMVIELIQEFLSYTFFRRIRWEMVERHATGFYTDYAIEYDVLYQHKRRKEWRHWDRKWEYNTDNRN